MNIGIANIVASGIIAIGGIVASIIFSYVPRQRKKKIYNLQKELHEAYKSVLILKTLEESLEKQLSISKQNARKGFEIPASFETARIKKRIQQLEDQLKKSNIQ